MHCRADGSAPGRPGRTKEADLRSVVDDLRRRQVSCLDEYTPPAGGLDVRCEEPSWALSFHTGYAPRPSDHHDVQRLCERFDLELPLAYRS